MLKFIPSDFAVVPTFAKTLAIDPTDALLALAVLTKIAIVLDTTSDYLMEGVPTDVTDELGFAKKLIARNVSQMSKTEKREIINILMGDDDE